ncbi:MAG: hypothetical protein QMD07_06190 [Thermodesulfovibrionales bacterium]|nr:hypothetical protein [Thermodesulfovibrionales bacterium]
MKRDKMLTTRDILLPNPLSDIREFLATNLGEVEDKQFQLSEPKASFEIACNEP